MPQVGGQGFLRGVLGGFRSKRPVLCDLVTALVCSGGDSSLPDLSLGVIQELRLYF